MAVFGVADGVSTTRLLLSFTNKECQPEIEKLGFPQNYFTLPDASYELAQVRRYSQTCRNFPLS
jgi:hypothetical protein